MTALMNTVKHYWKVLTILFIAATALTRGAVWVSEVSSHVKAGDVKMKEFDQSEKFRVRTEEKLDALVEKVDDFKDEVRQKLEKIEKQNERIERKLDRGRQ